MKANEKMVLCLCGKCVSQFYWSPNYIVKRLNPNQEETDKCTYCDVRMGFDYVITKKKKR